MDVGQYENGVVKVGLSGGHPLILNCTNKEELYYITFALNNLNLIVKTFGDIKRDEEINPKDPDALKAKFKQEIEGSYREKILSLSDEKGEKLTPEIYDAFDKDLLVDKILEIRRELFYLRSMNIIDNINIGSNKLRLFFTDEKNVSTHGKTRRSEMNAQESFSPSIIFALEGYFTLKALLKGDDRIAFLNKVTENDENLHPDRILSMYTYLNERESSGKISFTREKDEIYLAQLKKSDYRVMFDSKNPALFLTAYYYNEIPTDKDGNFKLSQSVLNKLLAKGKKDPVLSPLLGKTSFERFKNLANALKKDIVGNVTEEDSPIPLFHEIISEMSVEATKKSVLDKVMIDNYYLLYTALTKKVAKPKEEDLFSQDVLAVIEKDLKRVDLSEMTAAEFAFSFLAFEAAAQTKKNHKKYMRDSNPEKNKVRQPKAVRKKTHVVAEPSKVEAAPQVASAKVSVSSALLAMNMEIRGIEKKAIQTILKTEPALKKSFGRTAPSGILKKLQAKDVPLTLSAKNHQAILSLYEKKPIQFDLLKSPAYFKDIVPVLTFKGLLNQTPPMIARFVESFNQEIKGKNSEAPSLSDMTTALEEIAADPEGTQKSQNKLVQNILEAVSFAKELTVPFLRERAAISAHTLSDIVEKKTVNFSPVALQKSLDVRGLSVDVLATQLAADTGSLDGWKTVLGQMLSQEKFVTASLDVWESVQEALLKKPVKDDQLAVYAVSLEPFLLQEENRVTGYLYPHLKDIDPQTIIGHFVKEQLDAGKFDGTIFIAEYMRDIEGVQINALAEGLTLSTLKQEIGMDSVKRALAFATQVLDRAKAIENLEFLQTNDNTTAKPDGIMFDLQKAL
ncbi:MAG: hypothetical protein ACTSXQ_04915 [Alphaproteobacteria bacterium]